MPAVAGKLEHKLAIYLHRLTLHCRYRKVFTTKNVKASYATGGNDNKREMFSRKCKGHASNLASLQHWPHQEQSIYEQLMKISPYTFSGLFFPRRPAHYILLSYICQYQLELIVHRILEETLNSIPDEVFFSQNKPAYLIKKVQWKCLVLVNCLQTYRSENKDEKIQQKVS